LGTVSLARAGRAASIRNARSARKGASETIQRKPHAKTQRRKEIRNAKRRSLETVLSPVSARQADGREPNSFDARLFGWDLPFPTLLCGFASLREVLLCEAPDASLREPQSPGMMSRNARAWRSLTSICVPATSSMTSMKALRAAGLISLTRLRFTSDERWALKKLNSLRPCSRSPS
jgi:hypothetical protein